jgi:thioesterase domain-containing protein/acyl carrier protein
MKPFETGESKLLPTPLAAEKTAPEGSGEGVWDAVRVLMSLQQKAPILRPIAQQDARVLSFSEERLWRLWQMQPQSVGMNLPFRFRIAGDLNLEALENALEQLIRRHDVLRTSYPDRDGNPLRVVTPPGSYRLLVEACIEGEEGEGVGNTVSHRLDRETHRPFDLEHGPLMRVKLFRLSATQFILSMTLHHIIFDGWSEGILFKELANLYTASVGAQETILKPLAVAYWDYARWQHDCLQGEMRAVLMQYWQAQFKDGLRAQQPPLAQKQLTTMTRASGRQEIVLSTESTQALKAFSRKEGATLFATLLASFKVLFFRYTDQDRLFVCTPIASRNRNELKGVMGYFINLLILQSDLSGEPSFREVLQRVRQGVAGAYAHQDLPFQQVVKEFGLSRAPLAQAMFVLQNYPQANLDLEGLEVERLDADNGVADFDLFLAWVEAVGELRCELKYNTDLYEPAEIEQFLEHYRCLLENILKRPEAKITSADLLEIEQVQSRVEIAPERGMAIAPRNDLERQLKDIWERELGRQPIGVTDNFFEAGGNSIIALQIFNEIRVQLGKDLPLSTLFQCGTIERLATVLAEEQLDQTWEQTWSSLVAIQPLGHKTPLFCIHGLGGNILNLYDLSRHLDPAQPFYGLQAQGLDGKQTPLNRVEDMAAKYIQEIRAVQPNGPYLLSGLSMGGMVAFEMAQQLQAQGQQIALLGLLDTYGSIYYKPLSFRAWLARHLRNFRHLDFKDKLNYPIKGAAAVRRRVQDVWKRWQQPVKAIRNKEIQTEQPSSETQFTPLVAADGEETYVEVTPVSTANSAALLHYTPTPYSGQIVLFRAHQQPWWSEHDPLLGWAGLAEAGIRVYAVSGHHHNMTYEPHVIEIAQQLSACIDQVRLV